MTPAPLNRLEQRAQDRRAHSLVREGQLSAQAIADRLNIPLPDLLAAAERERCRRTLTPRELELVRLYALGWSYKEIAGQVGIVEGTVNRHMSNIRRRMGSSVARPIIVQFAILAGLIEPGEGVPRRIREMAEDVQSRREDSGGKATQNATVRTH